MTGKHHAYVVKWRDSATLRGWHRIDSQNDGVSVITSIGWLVRQTRSEITLTTGISESGMVIDQITIPRETVTKMTRLRNYVAGERGAG